MTVRFRPKAAVFELWQMVVTQISTILFTSEYCDPDPMNDVPSNRLISLDAFRGLSIAAMILVNDPGSWDHVYPQLLHAEWIGWTFTDSIFPTFLFIIGVAMWFSFKSYSGEDRAAMWNKILLRAGLIFLVGIFISWFPFYHLSSDNFHFVGVLQRIAVSYVIASVICISFGHKMVAALATLLLLGYWLLTVQIGGGEPYVKDVFFSQGIDLVSFRSCLSSAVPIMIGYLVGSYIDRPRCDVFVILKLAGVGIVMTLIGMMWSLKLPIIKSLLWSSSYVLFSVGISIVAFSVCLYLIEEKHVKSWAIPFVHIGLNPLFLYAFSIILDKLTWLIEVGDGDTSMAIHVWIHETVFRPWTGDINGSLLYAICFVAIHWLIAYGMFRKRIFVKV